MHESTREAVKNDVDFMKSTCRSARRLGLALGLRFGFAPAVLTQANNNHWQQRTRTHTNTYGAAEEYTPCCQRLRPLRLGCCFRRQADPATAAHAFPGRRKPPTHHHDSEERRAKSRQMALNRALPWSQPPPRQCNRESSCKATITKPINTRSRVAPHCTRGTGKENVSRAHAGDCLPCHLLRNGGLALIRQPNHETRRAKQRRQTRSQQRSQDKRVT